MARLNTIRKKSIPVMNLTHEGAKAARLSPEMELRRTVLSCMLWENTFYEDGQSVTDRLKKLIPITDAVTCASLAIEARDSMKLRHVPLLILREMARHDSHKPWVAKTLAHVIQRPDELTEFLAIYWADGKDQPIAACVKKGLAQAFGKFDAYSMAKYNRDGVVKLRDVMFLVHPKPKDHAQENLFRLIAEESLKAPDTWEVSLSAGADKKETFTRLIKEEKLGGLAFIRNLRNMDQAGVSNTTIKEGFKNLKTDRILPFRYIAAARHAPNWEPSLENAMFQSVKGLPKLKGKTVLLVDVSGSMESAISAKSEMTRMDAACGLAVLCREICEDVEIFSFSSGVVRIPPRQGFALRDKLIGSQDHGGTELGMAVASVNENFNYDRIIVFTDEQSSDVVPNPKGIGYVINVANYKNGVGYGAWNHIDGFSEHVISYIRELESWGELLD